MMRPAEDVEVYLCREVVDFRKSINGLSILVEEEWPKLERVLDDGRLPLDTNLVENAIRPFVVGRKNWLFADTVAGARSRT